MQNIKYLIEELEGVEFVHITENPTFGDNKTGLPPISFKVYVLGGKKKDIANTIWLHKACGYVTVGNTQVKVKGMDGLKHSVSFERLL